MNERVFEKWQSFSWFYYYLPYTLTSPTGITPLSEALFYGHRDVAWALIAAGADLTQTSDHGSSYLHDAARSGDLELLKLMLKQGLDINQINKVAISERIV